MILFGKRPGHFAVRGPNCLSPDLEVDGMLALPLNFSFLSHFLLNLDLLQPIIPPIGANTADNSDKDTDTQGQAEDHEHNLLDVLILGDLLTFPECIVGGDRVGLVDGSITAAQGTVVPGDIGEGGGGAVGEADAAIGILRVGHGAV